MQTVICDRCGKKLFTEAKYGHLFGHYYAPRGFDGNIFIKKLFGDKNINVDFDLCEDCAKEFATWLHIDDNK